MSQAHVRIPAPPRPEPDLLRKNFDAIIATGNRFVGTPGERHARQVIEEVFTEIGLADVRIEEFSTLAYSCDAAWLQYADAPREVSCVGLQSTAAGTVAGEAVFLGAPGSVEAVTRFAEEVAPLAGKIAVLQSFWPFAFCDALVAAGAIGIVVISTAVDGQIGHYTAQLYPPPEPPGFAGRPLAVPGVIVEATAGMRLVAQLASRPRVLRICHSASYRHVTTGNIVAEIPGEGSDDRVVLGAHYDTQIDGVGASDNATGVAALLSAAEAFRAAPPWRTTVFCAFANEEGGCWGSMDYCVRHYSSLASTVGMVNLDALGWAFPARRALHCDDSIRALALAAADACAWPIDRHVEASVLPSTDMNAFIDAGVPACFFWRNPPKHPFYHAGGDRPEYVDLGVVAETARVATHTASCLANDRDLDLGRARPQHRWADIAQRAAASRQTPGGHE
jgi:hypothetical protein